MELDFDQFAPVWMRLGGSTGAEEAFTELRSRYGGPNRHHHTAEHVLECLGSLEHARTRIHRGAEVIMALYFHDAVYEAGARDNEQQSALLFRRLAQQGGLEADACARIRRYILQTRKHQPSYGDADFVRDADLSILGTTAERYARFERDIRREYAAVPEPVYRLGRSRVLRSFLDAPRIFVCASFSHLEKSARLNLSEALGRSLDPCHALCLAK